MIVYKEDIDSGIDLLPVRNGCGYAPCACSGYCKIIVGFIDRSKYLDFVTKFVSIESFIEANLVKAEKEVEDKREVLMYELVNELDKNNARLSRYNIINELKAFVVSTSVKDLYAFVIDGGKQNPIFIFPSAFAKEKVGDMLNSFFELEWKTHYK